MYKYYIVYVTTNDNKYHSCTVIRKHKITSMEDIEAVRIEINIKEYFGKDVLITNFVLLNEEN